MLSVFHLFFFHIYVSWSFKCEMIWSERVDDEKWMKDDWVNTLKAPLMFTERYMFARLNVSTYFHTQMSFHPSSCWERESINIAITFMAAWIELFTLYSYKWHSSKCLFSCHFEMILKCRLSTFIFFFAHSKQLIYELFISFKCV